MIECQATLIEDLVNYSTKSNTGKTYVKVPLLWYIDDYSLSDINDALFVALKYDNSIWISTLNSQTIVQIQIYYSASPPSLQNIFKWREVMSVNKESYISELWKSVLLIIARISFKWHFRLQTIYFICLRRQLLRWSLRLSLNLILIHSISLRNLFNTSLMLIYYSL